MKTLILGLGNPICGDDGVGLHVARAIEGRLNQQEVTVVEASAAGLDILDLLTGYERVIIIDAIQTKDGKAGQIYQLEPGAFEATQHTTSPHDIDFATALALGKKLGLALPKKITIFAIEVENITFFSEECTPKVMKAVPTCVRMILKELKRAKSTTLTNQ